MNNIIEIDNLNYLNLFKNFTIKFEKNKLTSIAGPNNSGKTTLLRIIDRQIITDYNLVLNNKKSNEYKITDYYKNLKTIIPNEQTIIYDIVDDEINYCIDQLFLSKEEKNKRLRSIYKNLSLNKIKKESIKNLAEKDFIRLQIALAIASMPKVVLIDDISPFFTSNEIIKLIEYFKKLIKEYDITIILATSRLDDILSSDYLYIISENEIVLEGSPIDVVQKDNVINRIGMRVPFMIDLSVKLKDYGLINSIELDSNRMVELLWK